MISTQEKKIAWQMGHYLWNTKFTHNAAQKQAEF